jgi:hypothetical protein
MPPEYERELDYGPGVVACSEYYQALRGRECFDKDLGVLYKKIFRPGAFCDTLQGLSNHLARK